MSWRANIVGGLIADAFKTPVKAYQCAAGASSASVTINDTSWDERIARFTALGADIRWNINAAATTTTHFLKEGESIEVKFPWTSDNTVIHALRNASTSGTLEITTFRQQT